MAGTATPIFPQTVKNFQVQIANADGTTLKTLVTGGTNGTKVEAINVSSTDTSNRDIRLWLTVGGVDYQLGTVQIPLSSGDTNAIAAVALLEHSLLPSIPVDANGNTYVYVANGAVLKVSCTTTVTTAKTINFVAQGGDY